MKKQMMTTNEYVKNLAFAIEKSKANYDGVYFLNEEQFNKFQKVQEICLNLAKANNGKVVYCDATPNNIHGGISVKLPLLDLYKNKLQEFRDILDLVDVFAVDPRVDDSIQLDFSISNVWITVS